MGCGHYKLQGLQTEIGKKLQNGLRAVYRSLTLGPVAGYHVSLGFFFFSFLFSRDLCATSRLVLDRRCHPQVQESCWVALHSQFQQHLLYVQQLFHLHTILR